MASSLYDQQKKGKDLTLLVGIASAGILYTLFFMFIRQLLPTTAAILAAITQLYKTYGYAMVYVGALLESTFLVGFYLPGSAVVLLGAALSKTGVLQFPVVLFLAVLGAVTASIINYLLGRFGWYKVLAKLGFAEGIRKAEEKLYHHRRKTLFLGFIGPSSGSFVATAAGALKLPFGEFIVLALCAQLFWISVWATVAYIFGTAVVEFILKYLGFVFIGVIGLWIALYIMRNK